MNLLELEYRVETSVYRF